jgi:predicted transcriptional regulator
MMKVVSFKVEDDTKKRMDSIRDINWSEVLRRSVDRRLEAEEALTKGIDRKRALKAAMGMDRLRKATSGRWSGSEEIRKWRQRR